ncbi:MAG TPA: polysaccharide biosynthesis tyrosine autokinase [Leptolyngbyaceae cyanobacterium]
MKFKPTSLSGKSTSGSNGNGHSSNGYLPVLPVPQVANDGEDFDLSHLLAVLKRRVFTFVGVTSLAVAGLTSWYLSRPLSYQGSFELLVEPVTVVNKLDLGELPLSNQEQLGLDYNSQIRVLRSPTVVQPILQAIQERYPHVTYDDFLNKLTISRQAESKVLRVTYSDSDSEEIEFVMEQVAQGFIDYSVQDRQADLRRGLDFLDKQLDEKRQEVTSIETELRDFQKQYNLVDVEATSTSVTERLNTMLAQQENLQVELASLQTLYRDLENQVGFSPEVAVRISNLSESPQYQTLLEQLRLVEQKIALESARFQVETPMIQALEDQRQQLLPLLQEEAQRQLGALNLDPQDVGFQGQVSQTLVQQLVDTANQIQVIQTKGQAIDEVNAVLGQEIQRLADLGPSFQQIARRLAVAETSFNQLLASRQELRFQMARQNTPWELMTPLNASSITPLSNLPRSLVLSGLVSLLFGASAALLQDKLDRVFHTVEEVLEATKLPALATIPYVKGLEQRTLLMSPALVTTVENLMSQASGLVSHDSPSSFIFAESFYSLYTNLRLLGSDTPMQVVTVTSTRPSEGKSTVSAHLAIAATNMGQRVLLIDADLRKPSLHSLFKLQNNIGLSNLITGHQEMVSQAIQPIQNNGNLHLLSAGIQPPAPGGLLSSKRMQQLIEGFRRTYDLIILDTPPLMGIIDAKLAATHADGLLMVTHLGKTPRTELQRVLLDLNNTMQAPLLGLVVNGGESSSHCGYYRDYYGYYGHQKSVEKE